VLFRILKITALAAIAVAVAGISAYFTFSLIIKSEAAVVVPELVDKDVVYVLELLTDLELNTKVKGSEYSETISKNRIIFQEPEAGAEIKKGRDVTLIISKGPETILVPNLKGASARQARLILEENGLRQGHIAYTYHNLTVKEFIIAQSPAPEFKTRHDSACNMLVSMGPRPGSFKIPELKGLYLDDAISRIEDIHLVVGNITATFQPAQTQNTIISQQPPSGYRVTEGSEVNLIINRKAEAKEAHISYGMRGIGLFQYKAADGFLKRHIRIELNCFGLANTLFDNYVHPGKSLWYLIPGNAGATVLIYEDDILIRTQVFD